MMMISVFLTASNCRYHGTSLAAGGSELLSAADRVVFSGSAVDVITSAERRVGMK